MRINFFFRQLIFVFLLGSALFLTAGAVAAETTEPGGVSFSLENVEAFSDRTVFQISLQFSRPDLALAGSWHAELMDEKGLPYPVIDITPSELNTGEAKIFQTSSFVGTEALTLSVSAFPYPDSFPILEEFPPDYAGFLFDPGQDPQPGDVWELDESLPAGPFTLRVVGARMPAENTLVFEIEPVGTVTDVMLFTTDPNLAGARGGPAYHGENITSEVTFHNIPEEPFPVSVSRVYYGVENPPALSWQPPAATEVTGPILETTPMIFPFSETQPTRTPASDIPYQAEVRELAQKFEDPLRQGPGWIHVVTERHTDPSAGQSYPPEFIRSEYWYETDDTGLILNEVSMDYGKDDHLLQRSATKGGYTVNYTAGGSGFFGGFQRSFSLDTLSRELADAQSSDGTVLREEVTCADGGFCLLFTLLHDALIGIDGQTVFSERGIRIWLDRQSGQQTKWQTFERTLDGSEKVTETTNMILVEKSAQPPQEILELLERIILPPG